jgi:hypothetical protein
MSPWLIALVGGIYLYIAIEQAAKSHWWMAVVYVGYAVANVGLYKLELAQ